jgi:hypothetical protein
MDQKQPIEEAWKLWQECLSGNDDNSIFNQISLHTWDTAIFRLILDSWNLIIQNNPDNPPINPYVQMYIWRSYLQSEASFIRRIMDSERSSLFGKFGVFSLRALLKDIKDRKADLTRDVYLQQKNFPYDYTEIIHKRTEYVNQQYRQGKISVQIPSEFFWEPIEDAHKLFDRLSRTSKNARSRNDIISDKVFTCLDKQLDNQKDIVQFVDKFIAHASTPESQQVEDIQGFTLTLRKLWDAHQTVYEISKFLSNALTFSFIRPMPLEGNNLYENWIFPVFQDETRNQEWLKETFTKYRDETEQWGSNGTEKIWQLIEA